MNLALALQTGMLPVDNLGVRVLEIEVDQFSKIGCHFIHFLKAHLANVFEFQLCASPVAINEIIDGIVVVNAIASFTKLDKHGVDVLRVLNKCANVAQRVHAGALTLFG